jgi:S1-C subfamily serine protease
VSGSFGSPEKAYIDLESKVEEKDAEKVVLGVRYAPIDNKIQAEYNLPYSYGVLVLRGENKEDVAVVADSPADKAGISENDIILEVDGVTIDDGNSLTQEITKHKIGDKVELKIWRKGEGEKELWVELTQMK